MSRSLTSKLCQNYRLMTWNKMLQRLLKYAVSKNAIGLSLPCCVSMPLYLYPMKSLNPIIHV
jgi:hypothetical protein